MTITLRGTKGSALTHNELDGNFTDLNTNKAALTDLAASTGSSLVGTIQSGTGLSATTVQTQLQKAEFFESIAALRLWSGSITNKTVAFVRGYYAAGDGGGGLYYWDSSSTATENSGTVIVPTGQGSTGRFLRIYDAMQYSVKVFGAKGDGTTDDTTSIQNATAAALLVSGRVFFPVGNYLVTSSIVGQNNTDAAVMFEGESQDGVIIKTTVSGTTPIFKFVGGPNSSYGAGVRKLRIEPTNAGAIGSRNCGAGILCQGVTGIIIEDVFVKNMTVGLHLHNSVASTYTEQTRFRMRTQYCDSALRMQVTSGNSSFHGTGGYLYADVDDGQIGLDIMTGAYWYNFDLVFDGVYHGTSPKIALIAGTVSKGLARIFTEKQSTNAPNHSISGGTWDCETHLTTQGGAVTGSTAPFYYSRDTINLDGGLGFMAAKRATLAANATMNPIYTDGAMMMIRDASGGKSGMVTIDGGGTVMIISDPNSILSTVDGGAASNKIVVTMSAGVSITITNRYATSKIVDTATYANS